MTTLQNATRAALLEAVKSHLGVSTPKEVKEWVYVNHLEDEDATGAGWGGLARDLKNNARNLRQHATCLRLFELLSAEANNFTSIDSLAQRKVKVKGNGRITWASVVRGTVHLIADHAQAAKNAVDAMEDSELKFTSLKTFRAFSGNLKQRIDSQSDDPVVTLRAEVFALVGATTPDEMNRWFWENAPGSSEGTTYDWSDHDVLVKAQRFILEHQGQHAA